MVVASTAGSAGTDPGSDVVGDGAGELDRGTPFCFIVAESKTSDLMGSAVGVDGREVVAAALRSKLVFSRFSLKEVEAGFGCRVAPGRRLCLEAEVIGVAVVVGNDEMIPEEPFCAHEAARGKPAGHND